MKLMCAETRSNPNRSFAQSTGEASPMAMEPTACHSKRGAAFDFKDANDLDALAPGMSWW